MESLYYFNPENDLCLASGREHYTAPAAAMHLHQAGEVLPLWYGDNGDRVLCHGVNDRWFTTMQSQFGFGTDIFDHNPDHPYQFRPWGWSLTARRAFLNEGFSPDVLPSDAQLAKIRELSHRRTAIEAAKAILQRLPDIDLAAPAVEVFDNAALEQIINSPGDYVVKMPWSGSGRGMVNSALGGKPFAMRMGDDAIRRQGSALIERAYDKVLDFAKIFECAGSVCRELGTSVFITDVNGSYSSNLLAPEHERLNRVGRYYPLDKLSQMTEALREFIETTIAPYYDGILGVDMLVDRQGLLDPVVEINLRYTMGYVANVFADRYLAEGRTGQFVLSPSKGKIVDMNDYNVVDNKLDRGTLQLVPPNPYFDFLVTINS